MAPIHFLTDLGDLAVLLPLSTVILAWLLLWPRWDAACWWLLSLAFCAGFTALLKIFNTACPGTLSSNPSGHASLSLLVYGAAFVLVSARAGRWPRILLALAGITLALAIAVSRVLIGAHSVAEVFMGMAIGSAALALFVFGFRRSVPAGLPVWTLTVPAVLVVLLSNGRELQAAEIFQFFGLYLHQAGICG